MEERDPLLSNALQSSLWEIKTQQCHILPSIAKEARFIQEPLPSVEYDMASALECTGGHIFDRELKKRVKEIMLTFERPNSMALAKGERMVHYWHLTTTHRAYESHITTPFRKISIVEPWKCLHNKDHIFLMTHRRLLFLYCIQLFNTIYFSEWLLTPKNHVKHLNSWDTVQNYIFVRATLSRFGTNVQFFACWLNKIEYTLILLWKCNFYSTI